MKLEDFSNTYTGEKNCFDCKHFKAKVPVNKDGLIIYDESKVRCTKGFILREPSNRRDLREPIYLFSRQRWLGIEKGWRHFEWGVANVCEDFESMVDDDEILIKKIIRAGKILDAIPCHSTMFYNPETEEIIEIKDVAKVVNESS